MTKKHFAEIASVMRECRSLAMSDKEKLMWDRIASTLVRVFVKAHKNFDRTKFIDACFPPHE